MCLTVNTMKKFLQVIIDITQYLPLQAFKLYKTYRRFKTKVMESSEISYSNASESLLIQERSLCIKVKPALSVFKGDNIYHMESGDKRGRVLLINFELFSEPEYKTRSGTQVDVDNLTSLFDQIGFQVTIKNNLTAAKTLKLLINFSEKEEHGSVMIVVVLSHGLQGGKIVCSDSKTLDINTDILR